MKLVLLGTNGWGPSHDGQTACYMIPELGIVLDAGSGFYRVSEYLQTPSLDVYLSHAHLDHTFGLTFFGAPFVKKELSQLQQDISDEDWQEAFGRGFDFLNKINIHAAGNILPDIQKQLSITKELPDVNWHTLDSQQELPDGGILTHFALEHTIECYGFRLDWSDRSLAYVTDTVADVEAAYVEKIRGVDVLLHECTALNRGKNLAAGAGHSHTQSVVEVAAKAEVGRLILIHHAPIGSRVGGAEFAAAREIFPATEIGLDNMEIEF